MDAIKIHQEWDASTGLCLEYVPYKDNNLKTFDWVTFSHRNESPHGGTSAYAGMTGMVVDLSSDGSFSINCISSWLVVPSVGQFGEKDGVWLIRDGIEFFHKFKHAHEGDNSGEPWLRKLRAALRAV